MTTMEDAHLPRTQAHHYRQDPSGLHPAEGEDENHHEKKSLLNKVKTKAMKIKNTLTMHNHDHDDEYEEDEDKDEDMVEHPETHAAPSLNESDAGRSAVPGPIGKPHANLERPSVMAEDRYDSKMADPPVRPVNRLQEEQYGQPKGNLSGLTAKDEVHHLPEEDKHVSFSTGNDDIGNRNPTGENLHGQEESPGQERNKIGFPTATEGIRGSGENLHGQEESPGQERNKIGFPTAIEGNRGSGEKNIIGQEQNLGGQTGRNGMDTGMEEDPHGVRNGSSHVQAKATNLNGRGGSEEAAGITPVLSSFNKMRMHDNPEQKPNVGENLYTGSHDQFSPEPLRREHPDSLPKSFDPNNSKDLPHPDSLPKSFDPNNSKDLPHPDSVPKSFDPNNSKDLPRDASNEKPSSQTSTYTGKITSVASSITDTATSAKNVVASKLGYSGNKSTGAPRQEVQGQGDTSKPASETGYAQKIAATVTETLAPVYGKVAGAGSTIVSKVQGTGTGTGTGTGNEGKDKGGGLAEKLKPGEEDKALSEMITGSFSKHKAETERKTKAGEEVSAKGGPEVTSDVHKREPEDSGDRKGKVTESEEVAKRLGTGGEEEGGGKGVVDRVKGMVGSWLGGKGGDTKTTPGTTYAGNDDHGQKAASE